MEAAGYPDDEIQADVPHVLELVGLSKKANNFSHELSGGEQQRVAIARAIVTQLTLLLPTSQQETLIPSIHMKSCKF